MGLDNEVVTVGKQNKFENVSDYDSSNKAITMQKKHVKLKKTFEGFFTAY